MHDTNRIAMLDVGYLSGFAPTTGNSFTVLTYGAHSGTFTTVVGNGKTYTTNYNPNDLTLVTQ